MFLEDQGQEIDSWVMVPGGEISAIHVPMGQYHTCCRLKSGTVIIEFKNTKYNPERTEEFLKK